MSWEFKENMDNIKFEWSESNFRSVSLSYNKNTWAKTLDFGVNKLLKDDSIILFLHLYFHEIFIQTLNKYKS